VRSTFKRTAWANALWPADASDSQATSSANSAIRRGQCNWTSRDFDAFLKDEPTESEDKFASTTQSVSELALRISNADQFAPRLPVDRS
jgi:hypothetical protein